MADDKSGKFRGSREKRATRHILIAHYNRLLADALAEFLKQQLQDVVVSQARYLRDAAENAGRIDHIDLIILHHKIPNSDSDELSFARSRFPDVPVVLLSDIANRRQIADALASGAAGFLTKDISGPAVIKALELVLAGEIYVPSVLISESGSPGDGDINSNRQLANLTRREQDVLSRLVRGYSNKRIANEIGTKEITVAFHLRGVFKKLGVSNRTEAVAKALSTTGGSSELFS